MDIIVEKQIIHEKSKMTIRASELAQVLTQQQTKLKILSLDCFDTLLWRKTALPIDLFYDLQHYPAFKTLKITAIQRASAEALARQIMFVRQGSYEIRLRDIYRLGFPHLDDAAVDALVADEIAAEIATCYAFPPMMELIREAKRQKLKVIIISNTYLEKSQLTMLLKAALPKDVMAAIDEIFCSCEFYKAKGTGLYEVALKEMSTFPHTVLHIGDNPHADQLAAQTVGINAYHFIQQNSPIDTMLRMQSNAATLAMPLIRQTRALNSPFRGVFAGADTSTNHAESLLGYFSLGPIMYAFARLICDDIEKLKQMGKKVKPLFLMRDGYLPSVACNALTEGSLGKQARISRFTATAAGFYGKGDVERFLGEYISILPFEYICRQLLLTPETTAQFIKIANAEKFPSYALCKLLLQDSILTEIIEQSSLFRSRLKRYFQDILEIEPGDTVIFVDIGYAGTAQQMLTTFLRDELGVNDFVGRYLMTLNTVDWQANRKGLIDPSWCEDRIMAMLSADVSLIEEFCCSGDNSVVNYDYEGNPLFAKSHIDAAQIEKIRSVQAECIRFIHNARDFFAAAHLEISSDTLREYALAELTRLLYFPSETEIQFLQGFHHDKNKGFSETYRIYDQSSLEISRLRQQGLLFKNQHPHVLRAANIDLSLALLAQRRYGLDINLDDRSYRQEWVKIILVKDGGNVQHTCNAALTYDGFYALCLPLDSTCKQIVILLGINYRCVQVASVELIKGFAFLSDSEAKHAEDLWPDVILTQMTDRGAKLLECSSMNGALISSFPHSEGCIFRFVFRPVG